MRIERTLAARSEVLEMLEVMEDRWLGRLDDDSPKVKRMRRVYLRVDYMQAPWTVAGTVNGWLLCLGSRAKASTLHGRRRRFVGSSVFHKSFRGLSLLVGDAEMVTSSASSTEFDST